MFIAPRDVPPAAPRKVSVEPAPSVKAPLDLLAASVRLGVLIAVVEPAAVVTPEEAVFCAPVLLPPTNYAVAVIVLLAPRFSVPAALTLLLPVAPSETVATLAVKLAAAEASRTPEAAVPTPEVPMFNAPAP